MRAVHPCSSARRPAVAPPGGARPPPLPLLPPPRRRLAPPKSLNGGGGQQEPVDLLRRAEQLRAQQAELEREAAQLAAALEGLPPEQAAAVQQALGAQGRQQQGAAPPAGEGPEEHGDEPALMADLPPELQRELRASGLAAAWQQHAEAVEAEHGDLEQDNRECAPLPESKGPAAVGGAMAPPPPVPRRRRGRRRRRCCGAHLCRHPAAAVPYWRTQGRRWRPWPAS